MFSLFCREKSARNSTRRTPQSFKPALEVLEDRSLMSVTLLNDTFNTENGGAGALNFSQFANWEVTRGTVDLIGVPSFFDYYPGNGLYVDLDGSTGQGGRMESRTTFTLNPGVYELRFDLGNDPGFPGDVNTAVVSLGNSYSESFSREGYAPGQGPPPNVPLETVVRQITVTSPTTGKLVFDQAGGDNGGLVIDNVRLTQISAVDIAAQSLAINPTQGGVDFTYKVTGAPLPQDTSASLYWASGPTQNDILGPATAHPFTIPRNTPLDTPITQHIALTALSPPPAGATYLLGVVDPPSAAMPHGVIEESNEGNNVQALAIPIRLPIDVKPESCSDPINLASEGVIPVTLFGTNSFQVSQVDLNSLQFAGAYVAHAALRDVNHDGKLDLVLEFRTRDTNLRDIYKDLLAAADTTINGVLDRNVSRHQEYRVSLTGQTVNGQTLIGFDDVDLFLAGKAFRQAVDELAAARLI